MFMLYAVAIGLALGLLLRGRIARLGQIRLRWAPLAIAGLAVQLVLFSGPVASVIGDAGPPIYVASTAAVLVAVLANWRIPGLPIVAAGAASNLLAIVANGGYMPASPDALAAIGASDGPGYSNSATPEVIAFAPLTDIFAMPAWLPFANVFSIGDVLIGLGVVVAIVAAMRDPRLDPLAAAPDVPPATPGASVPHSTT
jgi:hypothetical protein